MIITLAMWFVAMLWAPPKQEALAVWDHDCIERVDLPAGARVEAVLVDGKPDVKQARLLGAVVVFKTGCTWRYEISHH